MNYEAFLQKKVQSIQPSGFDVAESDIHPKLYKFQNICTRWALKLGRAALFEQVGLGKTFQLVSWADQIVKHTGGQVIILSPLGVTHQTIAEAAKLGVVIPYCESQDDVGDAPIIITNYERLDKFDAAHFVGVVCDESSIIKNESGKTRQLIIDSFAQTPYKLACSATPAPNDYVELGNHAEFLGVMPMSQMLATWFVHDSGKTQDWRLKKHAEKDFWRWLTTWAVCLSVPSDLGDEYDMPEYKLPPLNVVIHEVGLSQQSIDRAQADGRLFPDTSPNASNLYQIKRESLDDRIIANREYIDSLGENEPVIVWCDTNYEADALIKAFDGLDFTEVRGSHSTKQKIERLNAFSNGEVRIMITKASIAGFGLNWQHCHEMAFVGLNFSYEKMHQCLGRCLRYGQQHPVNAHLILAATETNVLSILNNKQTQYEEMQAKMNDAMREHGLFREDNKPKLMDEVNDYKEGGDWKLYRGDCVQVIKQIPDASMDFSVYSPPFSELYVYSDHLEDMGNSTDDNEFFEHYKFLIAEMHRVLKPGRLTAVHCMDLPTYKWKDGEIGIKDFSGQIIQAHVDAGFVYHSRVTIWKDPVTAMQRTKAHGLLHKTFTKDAARVRQGLPDYLLIFRKPGDNPAPVAQKRVQGDYVGTEPPSVVSLGTEYSIEVWQRYASPVWFDIDQGDTLNGRIAKANDDEKHIAPLQLGVIKRAVDLWTNEGDTVFTPFAGIGSELYGSIEMGRKAVGIELKESYFEYACKFLTDLEFERSQPTLWDLLPADNS